MRTTLAIDDDLLAVAKELAAMQKMSVGKVISLLARSALQPRDSVSETRNGISLLPVRQGSMRVTSELVQQLREELP